MKLKTKTTFIAKLREGQKPDILSLDYVKNYLKITYKEDDELIKDFTASAMVAAENFTGRSIFKKSVLVHIKNIEKNKINCLASDKGLIFDLPIKPFYAPNKENENCVDAEYIDKSTKIKIKPNLINNNNNDEIFFSYISFDSDVYEAIKIGTLMHIGLMYEFRASAQLTQGIIGIYFPYKKVFV